MEQEAPPDIWLLATVLTGRTVRLGERYPHICKKRYPKEGTLSKTQDLIYRERDCAACARARGNVIP